MNHFAHTIRTPRALSPRAAFGLLTSILVTLLASSSAPTPLYATYQARWGFSPVAVTVVFGVYAVAVLVSLLVLGSLSDHVGRRPVLLTALVAQAGVMLLFATASGLDVLLLARVLQGLATGSAVARRSHHRDALTATAPCIATR
jgi:MFS family permease